MQQTSKYQFNLVEGSDDFSPTPLNQNMEKVEEALEGMETAIEESYSSGNKPYVVGSYTGTGNTQTIEVGFRPSAVLVGKHYSSADASEAGGMCALIGGGGVSGILLFKDNGFTVYDNTSTRYPSVNWKHDGYWYVAFY